MWHVQSESEPQSPEYEVGEQEQCYEAEEDEECKILSVSHQSWRVIQP